MSCIQPILAAGTQPTRELARVYMERRRRPLWLHRQLPSTNTRRVRRKWEGAAG